MRTLSEERVILAKATAWFARETVALRAAFMASDLLDEECEVSRLDLALCDTASRLPELRAFRRNTLDRHRLQVDLRVAF